MIIYYGETKKSVPVYIGFQVPYQLGFKGQMYHGSSFLQVPVHHYQADFTTKTYKKYDKGTALLNVHASTGYKLQREVQGVANLKLGEEPFH